MSWQASIINRTNNKKRNSTKRGNDCPECAKKLRGLKHSMPIKGIDDLATLCPELVKEWDYEKNEGLTPQDVKRGSQKIVWWICPEGHSYQSKIGNRSILHEGCSKCRIIKASKAKFKPVKCIETGAVYDSIKEAAAAINISGGAISACLRGDSKSSGGYHWEYVK